MRQTSRISFAKNQAYEKGHDAMIKILRFLLCLEKTVITGARIRDNGIAVSVRPHKREMRRCPECGRRCPVYDRSGSPRSWRALDLGTVMCWLEFEMERVECPEHGVLACRVPWARHGSWFTRGFEDQVAWLTTHCSKTVVAQLMRIDWKTVGPICKRVADDLEASRGGSRFDGLRRLGVDETSYKKGHKYLTVVVDHERNRVVWACKGHGKSQLNAFFDLLTEEQRDAIEVVTADGATWIADVVEARCPNAERVMDPFHVVSWATSALDELRKQAWRDARKDKSAEGRAAARSVKGSKYSLLKNPEDLTERQASSLEAVARSDKRLYRGYLLKEGLRDVYKAASAEEARARLESWLSWACRCRIPEFVELSRKVRRRRDAIVRAVELGVSNARIESMNNKIKLTIRMGYGFRNIDNLIALIMLRCSDLQPQLPGRMAA